MSISFFIPAYNCADTIDEAVDSIILTNFAVGDEIIIVNDGSTDQTGEALDKCKKKYPNLVVIDHKRNKGGSAARNTAVEHSVNNLLFCLDSDNILNAYSIQPLKLYLQAQKADAASFQFQHFFSADKTKPDYTWSIPAGEFTKEQYFRGDNAPGQHGNYLFTKQSWEKAGGYAEGVGALDTATFGLRQVLTGSKFVILKDTFYYHRLDHKSSYWMNDAESKIWSVSLKATIALSPLFDLIDERFIDYMLKSGRYIWFYNLKNKPIKLADINHKKAYQNKLQEKTLNFVYPKVGLFKRLIDKLNRLLTFT